MSTKKERISESKLLKAMAEIEKIAKGDPLEEADPEGGLSTEGEPLSEAAPRGRGEQTRKSRRASASSSSPFGGSSSSSSSSDADESSDEDDGEPFVPPKSKKKGKVSKARSAQSSMSAASSDDGSSDDGPDDAEKSFREMADDDETMSKGLLVNDFLESMVDQLSLALLHVQKTLAKSIQGMEKRIASQIEDRFAKSDAVRRNFEARLAKGVAAIGVAVQDELLPMSDMIKSISNQAAPSAPRGKAVLNKGEINVPPWGSPQAVNADERLANGSDDFVAELREIPLAKINDWMFRKSANNQLDQNVILAFEADRYDPAFLPAAVRKAMYDDLVK